MRRDYGPRANNPAAASDSISLNIKSCVQDMTGQVLDNRVCAAEVELPLLDGQLETGHEPIGYPEHVTQGPRRLPEIAFQDTVSRDDGTVSPQRFSCEIGHVHAGADGRLDRLQFASNLINVTGECFLGENGPRAFLPVSSRVPFPVQFIFLGHEKFFKAWQHRLSRSGLAAQEQSLEDRFNDVFRIHGHGHRNAQGAANLAMLAKEHVEHDAVDTIIQPVVGDHMDLLAGLAIAIDPAFALLVAGWVPGEIIVEDSIEMLLQVDALAQAVSANQDMFGGAGQCQNALFTFNRRQQSGNSGYFDILTSVPENSGNVFCCWYESTEDNGTEAGFQQGRDDGDSLLELGISLALQRVPHYGPSPASAGGCLTCRPSLHQSRRLVLGPYLQRILRP